MCIFFLFRFVFNSFFTITAVIKNAKLKQKLAILKGASITLANEVIETSSFNAYKEIKDLSKYLKAIIYLLYIIDSVFLTSAIKKYLILVMFSIQTVFDHLKLDTYWVLHPYFIYFKVILSLSEKVFSENRLVKPLSFYP